MWNSVSRGRAGVEQAVKQYLPPCQVQCPIKEDIQRTNVLISLLPGDLEEAADGILQIGNYLYEKNPLFTICGYVCGLCELECNYLSKGGAIHRRLLKRFISDTFTEQLNKKEEFIIPKHKENVAVVGGGPGGLMCAWDLSKRGYRVTIFEASDRLGGALWLIPRYRLPEEVLSSALNNLVRIAGIDVKFNAEVSKGKLTLSRLRSEGYRAIFIAKGTPSPRDLTFGPKRVEGQDLSGVMFGLTFLYEVSHGYIEPNHFKGRKVLVIGGGNVAFDAARTATRLGGETTLICLENEDKSSKDGIPADHEEIRGAWEEGIRIVYSRGVRKIIGKSGGVAQIECPKCVSVFDQSGFNPQFDESDVITLDGDILIITVGQAAERSSLEEEDLLDERGRLAYDPQTLQSLKRERVFFGGDLRRIGFMADAMKDGMVAAESIERYLQDLDMTEGRSREYQAQDAPRRRVWQSEPEVLWIPPEKRMHFQVFEQGFTLAEAIEEAKRCMKCGPCMSCKACVSIGIQESLPTVEVNPDRCSGCGICVSICPYGAAHSQPYESGRISVTDTFTCKACGMCVVACPSGARTLVGDPTESRMAEVFASLQQPVGA